MIILLYFSAFGSSAMGQILYNYKKYKVWVTDRDVKPVSPPHGFRSASGLAEIRRGYCNRTIAILFAFLFVFGFDNVFSSTYKVYKVFMKTATSNTNENVKIRTNKNKR